jgi:hypothetical protein
MEELYGRLILFLFLAGMIATITTPIFMLKIWLELRRLQKSHPPLPDAKPKTLDERRAGVITVAGRLATVKAAIDAGTHITIRTYNFDAKDAYLNRRLYVNLVDFKADMAFEGEDALTAWEDLKAYIPRINKTSVLRTSDKLEFNPDHIQLGDQIS